MERKKQGNSPAFAGMTLKDGESTNTVISALPVRLLQGW